MNRDTSRVWKSRVAFRNKVMLRQPETYCFVLIHRLIEAVLPLLASGSSGSRVDGIFLLRQWTWPIALAAMEGCALYLDYSVVVSR
jgi:hypothetical protein